MKHYKDTNNAIYAYESDGSQDAFIKDGLVPISDADLVELRKPTPAELEATRIASIKQAANTLILSRYPEWKQLNMIRANPTQSAFSWIDAVIEASNVAEAAGTAVVDIVWPG